MKRISYLSLPALFFKSCILKCEILIACFLLFNFARAQQATTQLYTVNDGLPSSSINGVYEGHSGYLWVGTPNGLSRFDGRQFVNFGSVDGLPSLNANVVFEDSQHRLWVGTRKGMARFIRNRFIVYPVSDRFEISYVFNIIETSNKKVWALTNKGVYQFHDSLWQKIPLYPGSEDFHCRQIIEADSGLYVNYGDWVTFMDRDNKWKLLAECTAYKTSFFNQMYEHKGQIFISTHNAILKLKDNRLEPFLENLKGLSSFNYFFDSKNSLWYYFQEGDSSFHVSFPGKWQQLISILPNKYGIISGTTEDSHGNIWVATQYGLLKISEVGFTNVIRENIEEKHISAIPLADSNLLVSTAEGEYLYYVNNRKKVYKSKLLMHDRVGIIDCYARDDQGSIWLITRSRKLYRFRNTRFDDMSHLLNINSIVWFYSIAFDRKKQRLFFCGDSAVLVGNDKRIDFFIPANTKIPVPPGSHILATKKGIVLINIPGKGICLIDEKNNLRLLRPETRKNLYGRLYEDFDENIWFVDGNLGLQQFGMNKNGELELISTITKVNGLQDNSISFLTSDSRNRVWLSTPSGLDILQKDNAGKWKVFNYSKIAGLQLNDWNYTKLFADAKGDVWLNSFRNLIRFDARSINLKNDITKVVIEKVQLNLRDVDWKSYTDSLAGYEQFPISPALRYADNTISIHFNGISFSMNPRMEYSYQLLPFDTVWSQPNATTSVSFVKLSPGKYTFKVRSRDKSSPWSNSAVFSFTIIPPFWMRWWFIAFCVLLIIAIIYSIYRYRINQLKKLLAIRTKISQDLHDEVGSTLTSINILSKVSQSNIEKDKAKAKDLMKKITEQSASMQQSMSDIVWSISPENDRIGNLVIRMREYLAQSAEPKNMIVEFRADENVLRKSLSMEHRRDVFLIFKEAVNNAVKYSKGERLSVFIENENHSFKLIVQDNGFGFDTEKVSSSSGLKNMKARANDLHGTLLIESLPGRGTTIVFTCPTT